MALRVGTPIEHCHCQHVDLGRASGLKKNRVFSLVLFQKWSHIFFCRDDRQFPAPAGMAYRRIGGFETSCRTGNVVASRRTGGPTGPCWNNQ